MRVIICEDNKNQKEKLEKTINDIFKSEYIDGKIVLSTDDAYEVINRISNDNSQTLFFLDIDLNQDINGIELAKIINDINENALIAMITSYEDMSHLTFKYHIGAIDYILKDNLDEAKKRVRECILHASSKFTNKDNKKYFIVSTGKDIKKVKYDDIIYFETSKKRIIGMHLENSYIEFKGTMKELEDTLDKTFIRCHRSYIINKNKIKMIDKNQKIVYLENNEKCFISKLLLKKTVFNFDNT